MVSNAVCKFATLLLEEVALVWVASADVLTFSSHDLGLVETLMVPVTGRSRGRWSGPAHLACQHKERRPPDDYATDAGNEPRGSERTVNARVARFHASSQSSQAP